MSNRRKPPRAKPMTELSEDGESWRRFPPKGHGQQNHAYLDFYFRVRGLICDTFLDSRNAYQGILVERNFGFNFWFYFI